MFANTINVKVLVHSIFFREMLNFLQLKQNRNLYNCRHIAVMIFYNSDRTHFLSISAALIKFKMEKFCLF
jgi:hypothetical protein